ncbi:MAG: helix-turn-helix domain-containing protein [Planctomycetota bacterium]
MPTISAKPARRVLQVVHAGVKLLDLAGPLQVFRDAKGPSGRSFYRVLLVSKEGGEIAVEPGITLATTALARVRVQPRDVLLVPGGAGVFEAAEDDGLVGWLARHGPRAEVLASTCTGAFLLAAAGLLDGRRAVTHWDDCDDLQRRHPAVQVDPDPIFIEDRGVWTSAGVTAGIDLALALVERDIGRGAALDVARRLVVHSKRSGGQSQFSRRLEAQVNDEGGDFDALHRWVSEHLTEDLRVERLAARCRMSPRTFHRAYVRARGLTPAQAVTKLRVEAARDLLEDSDQGVAAVARRAGFGNEEHMRRAFQRELGVSPSAYRAQWS